MAKKQKSNTPSTPSELRSLAEERLRLHKKSSSTAFTSHEELLRIVHELEVHQIELEMQQQELAHSNAALEASQERYTEFYDFAPLGYLTLSRDCTIVEANLTATNMLGIDRAVLVGMNFQKFVVSLDHRIIESLLEKVSAERVPGSAEVTVMINDKNGFPFRHIPDVHIFRIDAAFNDNAEAYRVILSDITESKHTEKKLVESRERFSQALDATHAGVWEWDLMTGENVWSDETWVLDGLTRGNQKASFELWASTIHPADRKRILDTVGEAAKKAGEINIEYRANHPDDRACWLMSRGKPLFDDKGHAVRYIGTVIDITELKKIEEALKMSEERFRKMFEKHSAIQLVLDPETGAIIDANQAAADFYGWSIGELRTMGIQDINTLPPEEVRLVLDQWRTSEQQSFVFGHRRADGSIRDVEIYGCRIPVNGKAFAYLILHDITERRKAEQERESLEEQLHHSQKMQMVGQLAGGIAHDFNNMLMVILGHTELALQNRDGCYEDLEAIHKAATHSAELTSQLLAFARRQTVKTKVFDLNTEVARMLSILKRLIGENITLRWMPGTRKSLVQLDPSQIDQILANLCVNARDAIAKSGIVTIETSLIHVDEAASAAGHACSIPGEYVMLTVTDTGEGIDKKHLPHVIEPFFTTKEVGKGTGMGLATVYGIVKQNHGCIEVKSKKREGTSVRIYLPLQREEAAERNGQQEPALPQGKEMILLVEDQPDILQLCRQMLERNGYTVLAALGPGEALELARRYQEKIELLVTDVVMPEMNGSDLYKELQTMCPHLKALFMSGYTADFLAQHLKGENGVNFIEKPFTFAAFTRIVREILKKVPE
jgi:two-component system cell cycle sensor histidine kinase/response regulator CckA